MGSWVEDRDYWAMAVADEDLLKVIELVAAGHEVDETSGDMVERAQTVWWLASRGLSGRDWGCAVEHARAIGSWTG